MALTAAQTAVVFQIFGVTSPSSADSTAVVVQAQLDIFGPKVDSYDIAPIRAALTARLAALSVASENLVIGLIVRWEAITSTKPVSVNASGAVKGQLADYIRERHLIRTQLSNIVAFAVPLGGFAAEAARRTQRMISR